MNCIVIIFLVVSSAFASPLNVILENSKKTESSIVIMDLDETVLDSHSRMYNAYLAAIKDHCGEPSETIHVIKSDDCEKLLGLSKNDFYYSTNGYSGRELMSKLGISMSQFIGDLSKSMLNYFLSGRWLNEDSPLPGATTFVRELKRQYVQVFFISSRYEDSQLEGTFNRLVNLGFLEKTERQQIILRKRDQASLEFKTEAIRKIKTLSNRLGIPVIGLFENEPENINVWKKEFPEATAILIKGNISVPTDLNEDIFIIDDYRIK